MSPDQAARSLVKYIQSLPNFVFHKVEPPNDHMGATIADAVLQANNKYDTHVTPRIQRILKRWPNAKTVSALFDVLRGTNVTAFLNWKGEDRAKRFTDILYLFKDENVETEADLRIWLTKDANLQRLHAISGVGPKTVDYFRIIVGLQSVAIDRRLLEFLGAAGITIRSGDYHAARDILKRAAALLSIPEADFDHSLWKYMGVEHIAKCAKDN